MFAISIRVSRAACHETKISSPKSKSMQAVHAQMSGGWIEEE